MRLSSTRLEFAAVEPRLPDGMGEDGWHAVRPNLATVGEAADWWKLVTGPVDAPRILDAETEAFLAAGGRGAGMGR